MATQAQAAQLLVYRAARMKDQYAKDPKTSFQQRAADNHTLNLAGTFVDLGDLRVAHHALNLVLPRVAVTAVKLARYRRGRA